MSVSFPIIYNSQSNSNIKKYYQNSLESNIVLENDILLKNMLQHNTIDFITSQDAQMYTESNVVVENTNFAQNLSITDVNCCLSNPTAFCIGSNFIQLDPAVDQSYTITTGTNVFKTNANTISAVIQLDANNSPIFDTDLLVTITDGVKLFNSVNEQWTALFEEDANLILQKAVNSGLNNQTGQSLLTIGEYVNFNNNYALGKNQSSYYSQDTITNQLISNTISNDYLPVTNNINISVDLTHLTSAGLGSYKIYQLEADITIENSNSSIKNHYLIGNAGDNNNNTDLKDVKSIDLYLDLFDDTSEKNYFKIQISNINNDSGLNFTDLSNNTYFTIDNSGMIDNLPFMENIVYPNYLNSNDNKISLEITQDNMTIIPSVAEIGAYITNNAYFSLTTNGEKLDETRYNQNGNIKLEIPSKTNRTTVSSETNLKFPQKIVDYNTITNELKINKDISYDIKNIIVPTGAGQYNSLANNNGTSLYTTAISFSTVSLSSNLTSLNDEIVLIKISPLTTLTNQNNMLYILNDTPNVADDTINAQISVQISGNISDLNKNDDLRLKAFPKKLTDLNLTSTGDSDNSGDNNVSIIETKLTTQTTTNGWIIGYSDNDPKYIKSSFNPFKNTKIFPIQNNYKIICNSTNNSNLPVTISYVINSDNNNEQIKISDNINNLIFSGSDLTNVNINIISITYKNTGITISANNILYHQIEVTKISTYNTLFKLNLAAFENINMMTPEIYAITTSYIYYPKQQNSQNTTVNISSDSKVITVTQTNGTPVTNFASFIYRDQNVAYNPITTVKLNSNQSITPLNAQVQYRNKTGTNTYTNWINTGSIIKDIEPFQNTFATISQNTVPNNYTISINIYPSQTVQSEIELSFVQEAYFIPLILNNANTTSLASGYKYKMTDLTETMITSFDPNSYINSNLPVNNNILNLSTSIVYTTPDAAEGNATYSSTMIISNTDTQETIATINIDNPDFSAPIILAKINRNLFRVIKTVNTVASTSYIWGDNATNYSSGIIDLSGGITVSYENIVQNDFTIFSLNTDLIAVNLIGAITDSPTPITSLTYNYTDSESLSIPYYRGYDTDDQTTIKTYDYIIKRADLTSYKINVTGNNEIIKFSSVLNTNIHTNSSYTVSFNNGINSIGTKVSPLFSRLPATMLINNKKSMPIIISSDSITISRNTTTGETSYTKSLKSFILYEFANGKVLKPLNVRVIESILNEEYILAYSKANTFVYYNSSYVGNPENITNWGTAISNVDFAKARVGFTIDQNGLNDNGFLNIGIGNNTRTNSITYFVIANPQLVATQLDINGAKQLPFDTTNPDVYDGTKLTTYYFNVNTETRVYNPFSAKTNLNNIKFTASSIKALIDYTDPNKNIAPTQFTITGSNIQIQEIKPTSNGPTSNGPNMDGIIFSGLISGLVEELAEELFESSNPYYSYINLVSVTNTSQINLTYTQEKNGLFETVFGNSNKTPFDNKPFDNIKFNINGYFIKAGSYKLVSSITKGIQTFIYDMIKQETSIILLKYECLNMDFTNIPSGVPLYQLNFVPTKVYTTTVTMPMHEFGENYVNAFNDITINNIQTNNTRDFFGNITKRDIIWTEITQTNIANALLNNFSLSIKAINTAGLYDMIELLYATADIPRNFTFIKQSNVLEILAPDGTPKFVITPFGQILTPNINTNAVTFFNAPINNNIDLMRSNANIFN
jgi:hypothetical protein